MARTAWEYSHCARNSCQFAGSVVQFSVARLTGAVKPQNVASSNEQNKCDEREHEGRASAAQCDREGENGQKRERYDEAHDPPVIVVALNGEVVLCAQADIVG